MAKDIKIVPSPSDPDKPTIFFENSSGDTSSLIVDDNSTIKFSGATVEGSFSGNYKGNFGDLQLINTLSDLPAPVSGVITLSANTTYLFTGELDLVGNRLEAGGILTILGTSSETSTITSTGLSAGVPLLTSRYTLPVKNITFKDVDTGIFIDDDGGANAPLALDWLGVNFLNVPNVGNVGTVDNFIYQVGALLNSQNLSFTGTVGTIAIESSLVQGSGAAGNIIEIASTATITRRFRIIYSSVIAFGSTVGLNANSGATIPVEGFILDTVNFGGGSTPLAGTDFTSEKALFTNCKGITNTTAIGNMFMKNNAVATVIPTAGARVQMSGVTETVTLNQKFTHILAANSMRYTSSITKIFKIIATFTVNSGNNNRVGVYLGIKNGPTFAPDTDRIEESEVYVTTNGNRPVVGAVQSIIEMNQNDEIYMIVQNENSATDITVEFLNMTIEVTN